jgi:recombination protein RecT
MTVQTNDNGKIVKSSKPGDSLVKLVGDMKSEIARAVPKHVSPERMARICTTAIRTVPKLAQSDAVSFIGSVLALAQLGLEPSTPLGLAWLIPRDNKRTGRTETTIMIGYQGYLDLARRSGLVTSCYAFPVFEGDSFTWSLGTDPKIHHVPAGGPRVDPELVTHVYAVARIRDADPIFEVLTREQVEARRKRSMAKNAGPWVTDTIAMMRKTAIRALWPYLPKSAEMASAEALDDAGERGRHIATVTDGVAAEVLDRLGAPTEIVDEETCEVIEGEGVG